MAKKSILIIILALSAVSVFSKDRTFNEMYNAAASVIGLPNMAKGQGNNSQRLQLIRENNQLAVIGSQQSGFAIIAKDDALRPIVGYSEEPFDAANTSLDWYITNVSRSMQYALSQGNIVNSIIPESPYPSNVEPIIKTYWNQGTPYNNFCPTNVNGNAYPTGCVATALSQIMYYYQYPAKGVGSHGYSFMPAQGEGRYISLDFSTITFDWNNMLADYANVDYTDQQAKAIANLMYSVGVAVEMQYSESGSGTYSSEARRGLIENFSYNANINLLTRSYYSDKTWMNSIFKELAASRPIYYTGVDESNGGHAFVLDGYNSDGLVHVNWGWGKNGGNGYYDIALLNPFEYQFSNDQDMLIGISPTQVLDYSSHLCSNSSFEANKIGKTLNIKKDTIYNFGGDTFNGEIGVVAQSSDGKQIILKSNKQEGIVNYYGLVFSPGLITGITNLKDGQYHIFIGAKSTSEAYWKLVRTTEGKANSIIINVANGNFTVGDYEMSNDWFDNSEATITGISSVMMSKNDKYNSSSKYYTIDGITINPSKIKGLYIHNNQKFVKK